MKKPLTIFLTWIMCFSLAVPAFAEETSNSESIYETSTQNVWSIQADIISQILESKQLNIADHMNISNLADIDATINSLSQVYLKIETLKNSTSIEDVEKISVLENEKVFLETTLANSGQYILSDKEVASIIRGSLFGASGGVTAPASAGDAVICPDDTANNKWVCSSVRSQGGYYYYTLQVIPKSSQSSLYEVHSGDSDGRTDWASFAIQLLYQKALDSAIDMVSFGLLGDLMDILENLDDRTSCSLSYNVDVTSYPKFTFVYDNNADEYFCTLITHSTNVSQIIAANVPNLSAGERASLDDKLIVSPNHTSPSYLAISRFKQGKTWPQVERNGYVNVVCQKTAQGKSETVSLTGFEPPYATGIYTVY